MGRLQPTIVCLAVMLNGTSAAIANNTTPAAGAGINLPAPNAVPIAGNSFDRLLDQLHHSAVATNVHYQETLALLSKRSSRKQGMKDRASDMLNYSLLFKGVSPSTEGSNAILNDKLPPKSLAAAAYRKQTIDDDVDLQSASQVLELAMGLGNRNQVQGKKQVAHAAMKLKQLAGSRAPTKSLSVLSSMRAQLPSASAFTQQTPWSVEGMESQIRAGLKSAVDRDATIAEIKREVHHYNKHKPGTLAAQRVTRTALSAATLTPTLVGPAAQVALFGEILSTGGTEQDKLLKELYIDKRLNGRIAVLTELLHTAIYNYHVGVLTGNGLLRLCSHQLLTRLTGSATTENLLN